MNENLPVVISDNGSIFDSIQSFEEGQRMAKVLAASNMVPDAYKGNLGDCMISMDMAKRMRANPLMIMQNLDVIYGRPAWRSQFIISSINTCGRYKSLMYDLTVDNDGKPYDFEYEVFENEWIGGKKSTKRVAKKKPIINKRCIAWTVDKNFTIPQLVYDYIQEQLKEGKKVTLREACKHFQLPIYESPAISIEMACMEGWYDKSGSKWKTMDELMLRYRSAAFFGRLFAPEILMGMTTVEEVEDMQMKDVTPPKAQASTTAEDLNNEFLNEVPKEEPKEKPKAKPKPQAPIEEASDFPGDKPLPLQDAPIPQISIGVKLDNTADWERFADTLIFHIASATSQHWITKLCNTYETQLKNLERDNPELHARVMQAKELRNKEIGN